MLYLEDDLVDHCVQEFMDAITFSQEDYAVSSLGDNTHNHTRFVVRLIQRSQEECPRQTDAYLKMYFRLAKAKLGDANGSENYFNRTEVW